MGSSKKQEYPTTTQNTGLYGNSVTNKSGTTWTPTSFQSQLVGAAEQNVPSMINQMINPDINNPVFQQNQAIRQRQQGQAFENQLINPMAERGLSRGSSGNALANMFSTNLARQEQQALLDESGRNSALIQQLMGLYATPYEMQQGTSQLSQAGANSVANYQAQQDAIKAQQNAALYGMIGNTLGGIGSAAGSLGAANILRS